MARDPHQPEESRLPPPARRKSNPKNRGPAHLLRIRSLNAQPSVLNFVRNLRRPRPPRRHRRQPISFSRSHRNRPPLRPESGLLLRLRHVYSGRPLLPWTPLALDRPHVSRRLARVIFLQLPTRCLPQVPRLRARHRHRLPSHGPRPIPLPRRGCDQVLGERYLR